MMIDFPTLFVKRYKKRVRFIFPAVVIPFNPEGMGIGEWVVLFSENFEGMGMGMGMGIGNSKKLCASAQFFFGIASESER